ncbi:MAG: glycerol-3-phosphate dehydrogenase [Actinomycetota bacterium]|nr:glycerol-3-phosphate dehydrogenase [Actinomycetota bacterium]
MIVIGAGINGCGIARDAALRGLKVVLIDKGDIAAGTTSWSTRLIHGGLRYLEHLEVGLVRESLRERERLLRIAPHLVRPLSFLIPIYERDRRGPWTIRAGMLAYDALSLDKSEARHHMLNPARALEREPGLSPEGLEGAAVYYDAQAEYPERLALENALDAHDHGAVILTHHAVRRLEVQDRRIQGVTLDGGETLRAPVVVNVAGPWVDEVLGELAAAPAQRLVGGTKGVHLVVESFPGAPDEALYVEAGDGRPYFIVPWNNLFLIGTTDTRYEGDLDHVVAEEEEIEYLISATNEVIPPANLTRYDVLYTYAGVRPLPETAGQEGSVTRSHVIHDHAPEIDGLLSIVGGKLTTFRQLAQETMDAVLGKLEREAHPCRTGEVPLPGGAVEDWESFAESFVERAPVSDVVARRLLRIYGTQAEEVLTVASGRPELSASFDPDTGAIGAEVVHALEAELAGNLADVLLRRTMVGLGRHAGIGADEAAARVCREQLGWEDERARAEVAAYREGLRDMRPRDLERASDRAPDNPVSWGRS